MSFNNANKCFLASEASFEYKLVLQIYSASITCMSQTRGNNLVCSLSWYDCQHWMPPKILGTKIKLSDMLPNTLSVGNMELGLHKSKKSNFYTSSNECFSETKCKASKEMKLRKLWPEENKWRECKQNLSGSTVIVSRIALQI